MSSIRLNPLLLPWSALLLAVAPTCDVHAFILVDDDVMACERPEFRQQLVRGDFSALNQALEERNTRCLWHFYLRAHAKDYGKGRTGKQEAELRKIMSEEQRLELNLHVKELAASYLKELPEHAEHVESWIDRIYEAQQKPTLENTLLQNIPVDYLFDVLVGLGSPACVDALMSHLDDERSLGRDVSAYKNPQPMMPNWFRLIDDLAYAKSKNRKPWVDLDLRQVAGIKMAEAQREMLRQWWASPESDAYKVKTPRAGLKTAAARPSGFRAAEEPDGAPISGFTVSTWTLIALGAGAIMAVTLLAARRRMR
jgi:hypothetical protein